MATYLESKGIEVVLKDCVAEDISVEELVKYIEDEKFGLVGITGFTPSSQHMYRTANAVKDRNKNIKVVVGGVHATAVPESVMNECDSVDYLVIGEGEAILYSLIKT